MFALGTPVTRGVGQASHNQTWHATRHTGGFTKQRSAEEAKEPGRPATLSLKTQKAR